MRIAKIQFSIITTSYFKLFREDKDAIKRGQKETRFYYAEREHLRQFIGKISGQVSQKSVHLQIINFLLEIK